LAVIGVAAEVDAFDDVEADIAQHAGHRLGVDRRVRKLRHSLVAELPTTKATPLVGESRAAADQKRCDLRVPAMKKRMIRSPCLGLGPKGPKRPIRWGQCVPDTRRACDLDHERARGFPFIAGHDAGQALRPRLVPRDLRHIRF